MSTFVLIRHGSTNEVGKILSGTRQGVILNEEGLRQARELVHNVSELSDAVVYSSPHERAIDTAMPIAASIGENLRVADELREIEFGAWTGKTFTELEVIPEWHSFNAARSWSRAPGGESLEDVSLRVMPLLRALAGRHPGGRVILVTHADVIRTIVLSCLGAPLDWLHRIRIDTGSMTVIDFDGVAAQLAALNLPANGAAAFLKSMA